MYKYLLGLFCLYSVNSLSPKKFPNGKIIKFYANHKNPCKDLKAIDVGQASLISRNWLQNIMVDIMQKKPYIANELDNHFEKKNVFDFEGLHIISSINKLETYIQESYSKNNIDEEKSNLFLAWTPKGQHGRTEVLFIIVVQIYIESKQFVIKHLVQSPFWDPVQIDSVELKNALIDQNKENNCTTINLEYLYDNDLRYKLAWAVWNLNYEINKSE